MAKKPTAKAQTNATTPSAVPAKKVEVPAAAQSPGSATAAQAGNQPDTTSQGMADVTGLSTAGTTPTSEHVATRSGVAAVSLTIADVQAAFNDGYTKGFSEALDGAMQDKDNGEPGPDLNPGDMQYDDPRDGATHGTDRDKVAVVALALMTPAVHRKGGLAPMVDRLQTYIDKVPPHLRDAAFVFMQQISLKRPEDLATGVFELTVDEALRIMGSGVPALGSTGDASSATSAADRFNAAFQQDSEARPEGDEDPDNVDPDDASTAAAAAARMAGALQ